MIVIASVTVSVITAIMFFIIGFVSSHCCQKAKQKHNIIVKEQTSLYHGSSESAIVKVQVQLSQERELELQANVSYASVH